MRATLQKRNKTHAPDGVLFTVAGVCVASTVMVPHTTYCVDIVRLAHGQEYISSGRRH